MLRLRTSLRDVVQSVVPCANGLYLFERRSKQINHIRIVLIVDDQVLNLFVADNVQGTHKDADWDVVADHWDLNLDRLALVVCFYFGCKFAAELLGRPISVLGY